MNSELHTMTDQEVRLEQSRQRKAKLEADRQATREAQAARKEAMRTTARVRLGRTKHVFTLATYSEWLANITDKGMQLMWVRSGTRLAVTVPDADWQQHEAHSYRNASSGLYRPFLEAIEAIGPDHDLATPPPCDLCGNRQAQYLAADFMVVCSEDCAVDRPGKAKRTASRASTRKRSSS